MLGEWYDQLRRKRQPADWQPAGQLLVLRGMNTVFEGIAPEQLQQLHALRLSLCLAVIPGIALTGIFPPA